MRVSASAEDLAKAIELFEAGATSAAVGKALNRGRSTIVGWRQHWRAGNLVRVEEGVSFAGHVIPFEGNEPAQREKFEVKEEGGAAEITSVRHDVTTVEDALRKAKIDTAIWEVERSVINAWEVVGKGIGRQPLWQVKVWLRRRAPKYLTDALEALCARAAKHAPKYPSCKPRRCREPHLLEICCFDTHFGKYAWSEETGQNYDLHIAERVFRNAVEDLVAAATGSFDRIERILFPVGNDFLHVDGLESATTKGTRVDSDGRYAKIIETASMALKHAIDYLRDYAPVDVLWIPGNHDRVASYHICREMAAWYRHAKNVQIDVSPATRKYYRYGTTLLGFCHGDKEPLNKLPHVMATERPEDWALTTWHEWHTADKHHAKQRDWLSVDEHNGTRVRIIPSLSGTDAWHFDMGYTGSKRAAEAFLWHKTRGYHGHFSVEARE